LARTVIYENDIPEEVLLKSQSIIGACDELEDTIREALLKYINGFSFGINPLRFDENLKSYLPIEQRKPIVPKFKLKSFIKDLGLPKHLRVKVVVLLIFVSSIIAAISTKKSKGEQFLDMADRMNISFVTKYEVANRDLFLKDTQGKTVLHHLAYYMNNIKNKQFETFKYLVFEKKLDPNQFDINGRTPIYYVIRQHLDPPKHLREIKKIVNGEELTELDVYLKEHLVLIKQLLKMNLKSKLKKNPSNYSTYNLNKQDINLQKLIDKYR